MPASPMDDLVVELEGPVLRVTLNRPAAMNALNTAMLEGLEQALIRHERDDAVRVVLVTAAGKAFCAGADLKAFDEAQAAAPGERDFLDLARHVFDRLRAYPKPVIVALNGLAMAGGLELAMCADIIVASDRAKIGDGHANYGVYPGGGGAAVLPRLVPRNVAMYLLFTGELIGADEMRAFGLVSKVYPAEQLSDEAMALAVRIAAKSPVGLRRMKAVARAAADKTEADALLHEQVMLREHARSADMREGLLAFVEKRAPQFTGR